MQLSLIDLGLLICAVLLIVGILYNVKQLRDMMRDESDGADGLIDDDSGDELKPDDWR